MEDSNKFALSKEKNREWFKKEILPEYQEKFDFTPKEKPIAHFTAGLPGAGKSNITKAWKKENPNILVIDADELRAEHPDIVEIREKYPSQMGTLTHPDATQWVDHLRDKAIDSRASFVQDSSLSWPPYAKEIIEQANDKGFDVKVTMVAVNEYESMQGNFDRYAEQYKSKPESARVVPPEVIKSMGEKINESMSIVDTLPVKEFKIVDRDKNIIYDKSNSLIKVDKALEKFTDIKHMEPQRVEKISQNWEKTIDKLKEVKAPQEIQNSAKTVYKAFTDKTKTLKQDSKEKSPEDKTIESIKKFVKNRDQSKETATKSHTHTITKNQKTDNSPQQNKSNTSTKNKADVEASKPLIEKIKSFCKERDSKPKVPAKSQGRER